MKKSKKIDNSNTNKGNKDFLIKDSDAVLIERERLASIGQMMGGLAHNLKTPLMGSTGQLIVSDRKLDNLKKSLEENSDKNSDAIKMVNEIYKYNANIRYYLNYMSDVMNTVKSFIRPNPSDESRFTIQSLFEKVKILTSFEAKKNRIIIDYNISDKLLTASIKGSVTSLVQILVNLIENAIDSYEGKPGSIKVDAYIDTINEDSYIKISMQDFGSGISDSVKEELFEKMTTTKGHKGSGIGIYLSNIIVKSEFDGYIDFTTEHNKGTTMYVNIPYKKA